MFSVHNTLHHTIAPSVVSIKVTYNARDVVRHYCVSPIVKFVRSVRTVASCLVTKRCGGI